MCGFAGFFRNGWNGDREAVIRDMADRIRHRNRSDDYYVDDTIAMGFRRLSIIDLEGGSQPIRNEDGTKVLTFNGEIYNFRELRVGCSTRAMCSRRVRTARCCCMATSNGARICSSVCAACLPL